MKKRPPLHQEDIDLFKGAFEDVAPIKQDKILLKATSSKEKTASGKKNFKLSQDNKDKRQAAASFQFSDGFEGYYDTGKTIKYVKEGADSFQIKRLRRGEYAPELILDLHGYTREQAKLEIAALIHAAQKQHVDCVCIVHGIGSYVLKKAIPNWLVQHPLVLGFHQAPLEWGGQGALLVLIELPQVEHKF